MDPMMMRNMMMARQMGGAGSMMNRYSRQEPVNANVGALQEQAQMMANQYAPLAEAQKVMGGMMAPQPNAAMPFQAADRAGLMAAMQAQAGAAPTMAPMMEAQAGGVPEMPVRQRPGGRPSARLMEARGRMAGKRAGGRMTPMAGRRNKQRRR